LAGRSFTGSILRCGSSLFYVIDINRTISTRACCVADGSVMVEVRFAGCSVKCLGCTSVSQLRTGLKPVSRDDLIDKIKLTSMGVSRVYFFGGEPFIQDRSEFYHVVMKLGMEGFKIVIETPGTVSLRSIFHLRSRYNLPVTVMINVRLASTGMSEYCLQENFKMLRSFDVLNFMCRTQKDFFEAVALLRSLKWYRTKPVIQFRPLRGRMLPWLRDSLVRADNPILQEFDVRMLP